MAVTAAGPPAAGKETHVGSRARQLRGELYLTGRAEYVDDVELPGMVFAAVLRSPHPHARIRGIDTAEAVARPGTLAVVTGIDAAALAEPIPHRTNAARLGGKHADVRCLALGKVVFAGQPVAAAVGVTRNDAEAALELVTVDYEPLPFVTDAEEALAPGAPLLYEDWGDNVLMQRSFVEGDIARAFAEASHVIEGELGIQRLSSQPIETRGYVASWDPRSETLTMHAATQNPHQLRWVLAQALRLEEPQLRVIAPHLGGSFGLKFHGHAEETLVCVLSRLVERPVKWIENRSECLLIGGREQVHRFQVAYDADGVISGLRDRFVTNVGAVGASSGWAMSFLTALCFPSGYRIPNMDVEVTAVTTNKSTWNAARGYGKEATTFVMERIVDLVARDLGLDPVEVRRRNLIDRDEFPYRTNTGLNIDSGDYHAALDKAVALLGYDELRVEQQRLLGQGRYLGIGFAFELTPEAADLPGALVSGYDTTTVRLDPSGNVVVLTGVTSPGGGNDTGIAQIVADELGVPPGEISVIQGDTTMCPYGFGHGSGRSMVVGGGSAALAARDIRAKLETVAAAMLDAEPADLTFADGTVLATRGKSISLRDLSFAIYTNAFGLARLVDPPLESTRVYKPGNITHVLDERGRIQPYPTYSNAVHVAVVEVDPETGKVEVRRIGCVHDCGNMINPALVEGQMHGAIAMGVGAALMENLVYDDAGRLAADRFKTYLMPRACDLPDIEMVHQVTPSPFTLLGTKGAGEAGVGGALAAVANAVEDALAPLGVNVRQVPLSSPAVLGLIREARERAAR